MKVRLFFFCMVLFLLKCSPTSPPKDLEKDQFSTTAPSKLYFNNIRSTNYAQTTQAGTKVDLYQLRKIELSDQRPIVYPVIADNWLEEKAYILVRTNKFTTGFRDPLTFIWNTKEGEQSDSLGTPNFKEQYRIAMLLNELLEKKLDISTVDANGEIIPLFQEFSDKSNFMIVIRDYLKLTEQIR